MQFVKFNYVKFVKYQGVQHNKSIEGMGVVDFKMDKQINSLKINFNKELFVPELWKPLQIHHDKRYNNRDFF